MRTAQLTTAEAATTTRTTIRTVRAWCRSGQLTAVKQHGRWAIRVSSVARLLCPVSDRPRRGECPRQPTPRAARRAILRQEARAVASEHGTRVIGHHQRARLACANSGYVLARDYLESIGCEPEFTTKYESAFGRKTAQTFRQNHHAEPTPGGIVILRGRLWHCYRYADIRDLHLAARAYPRTADMFGLVA